MDPVETPPLSERPRAWTQIRTELRHLRDAFDGHAAIVLTAAAFLLLVFKKYGGQDYFRSFGGPWTGHPRIDVIADLWWFLACFVLLGAVPWAILRALPKVQREERGLGLGDWRFGLKWVAILFAVMFPVIAIASRFEVFWRYYPLNDQLGNEASRWLHGEGPTNWLKWFLLYELLYAVYFIGWEYFYRGFLTLGLLRSFGPTAIFVGNVPFALMHSGKPLPEAVGSIVAGVALGLFAIRARSFWYCWLIHALIACSMDLLCIQRRFLLGA